MEWLPEEQGGIYTGDGTSLATLRKLFWAKLTDFDGDKYYDWTEQRLSTDATFNDLPGGRFGSFDTNPAFEANQLELDTPRYALLQIGYFDRELGWVYLIVGSGGGGGGTLGAVIRVPLAGNANALTAAFIEDSTDGTPPTFSDGDACWALDMNGVNINPGRYPGVLLLTHIDGKKVYGVESRIAVIRVPQSGSTGSLTAGFVEKVTDGNPPGFTDGANCWTLDLNSGIIERGFYRAVFLLRHTDGKPVYGVESGFTGVKMVCEGDGLLHTWTFARGHLILA